jgi:hypothetical protein
VGEGDGVCDKCRAGVDGRWRNDDERRTVTLRDWSIPCPWAIFVDARSGERNEGKFILFLKDPFQTLLKIHRTMQIQFQINQRIYWDTRYISTARVFYTKSGRGEGGEQIWCLKSRRRVEGARPATSRAYFDIPRVTSAR